MVDAFGEVVVNRNVLLLCDVFVFPVLVTGSPDVV